jgi:GntR family transcriptional regulator, transcriptional repressor for pyruvate dehydrogenase complex
MSGDSVRFVPAGRTRAVDDVVDQIRRAVLDGQIERGERLPNEHELGRRFAVSRSTLREGLRKLEALGVVEIRPGSAGGIFATAPQANQVSSALEALLRFDGADGDDLAEFSIPFEAESAYWAALRATREEARDIESLAASFRVRAEADAPWNELADLDSRFREAVVRASKNQVRVGITLALAKALLRSARTTSGRAATSGGLSWGRELVAIADAIAAGDGELARQRTRSHLQRLGDRAAGSA